MDKYNYLKLKLYRYDVSRSTIALFNILMILINVILATIALAGAWINGTNLLSYPYTLLTILYMSILMGITQALDFIVWRKIKDIEREYAELGDSNSL